MAPPGLSAGEDHHGIVNGTFPCGDGDHPIHCVRQGLTAGSTDGLTDEMQGDPSRNGASFRIGPKFAD
ncbi:hypothetical protein FV217_02375 [Methylobacterium sp. WL9]|nr:hypothetical protein FV217_02375 [Methylobacterium sp. WL9]